MYARVAIPSLRLDPLFYSYEDERIRPGSLVRVKLRGKGLPGIVVEVKRSVEIEKVKPILEVIEEDFIPLPLVELIRWVGRYYLAPLGQVLSLTIPKGVYRDRASRVLPPPYEKIGTKGAPRLSLKAHRAVKSIIGYIERKRFKTFLLLQSLREARVEVYLRLIEETLRLGRGCIVLLPEISLTPTFTRRFSERFGRELVLLHSGLKESTRRIYWRMIRDGKFRVVLGARSCSFAPLKGLGLIIVEEEEDPSYKEKRNPHYNARDVAVVRGELERAVVVLGSSIPSLESFYNARRGRYRLINLYSKPLSKPKVVDMRGNSKPISDYLSSEIKKGIKDGGVLLFLNRRGFSRYLSCADCGWISRCPYCHIPLIYKKETHSLECGFCRYREPAMDSCPNCDSHNFIYQGFGIERVVEELRKIRRDISLLKLEKGSLPKEDELEDLLFDFSRGKIKILIGTGVVIKRLKSSPLPLVGIISSDTLLNLPDFRAQEYTFRLLIQLSMIGKRVILQTHYPDNYAIRFAKGQDLFSFYDYELKKRKELFYPPFSRLVIIRALSKDREEVEEKILRVKSMLSEISGVELLGPTTPLHPRKGKRFIYQLLIKLEKDRPLYSLIERDEFLRMGVDIDPDPIEMG